MDGKYLSKRLVYVKHTGFDALSPSFAPDRGDLLIEVTILMSFIIIVIVEVGKNRTTVFPEIFT